MKSSIAILVAVLITGTSSIGMAKMDPPAKKISPCGSSIGVCGGGGSGGGGSSTMTCETTSWGNTTSGGTETVCMSSDGSSSWYSSEWDGGTVYEDWGSVKMQARDSFSSTSGSSDYSSSGSGSSSGSSGPSKFSGYAR